MFPKLGIFFLHSFSEEKSDGADAKDDENAKEDEAKEEGEENGDQWKTRVHRNKAKVQELQDKVKNVILWCSISLHCKSSRGYRIALDLIYTSSRKFLNTFTLAPVKTFDWLFLNIRPCLCKICQE